MKIIIPAIGSRGDVQPYIGLCQGLLEAGHEVILATNPTLCGLVESYQVPVVPVGLPVDMGAEGAKIWQQAGRNFWLGMIRVTQLGFRLVREAYPDLVKIVRGADLVVVTDTYAGAAEADQLGVPWVSVTLQPARVPATSQSVSPLVKLIFPVINRIMMAPINNFRKKVGAAPVKDMGSMLSTRQVLVPVSPRVFTPDSRWGAHIHMTGYWFTRSPQTWSPPVDLQAFLASKAPTVAISLGAMSLSGEATRKAALMTLEAVRQAGVRAVIQGWDEALQGVDLPETIYHAGSMPHSWLFSRVQTVIHHGGFGTTASGLRSGVPSIVVPHIIDQMYWAQRVGALGAGPKYIHRADLTTARLADAIRQAVTDPVMCARAAEIGAAIQAEPDGIQAAVGYLESAV